MTRPTAQLDRLREAETRATKGPWDCDSEKTDGSYGSGEDTYEGYHTFVVNAGSRQVVGAENSSHGEVHEEHDEDGVYAWDDVAKRNCEFIATARNDLPAVLDYVAELEAALAKLTTEALGDAT